MQHIEHKVQEVVMCSYVCVVMSGLNTQLKLASSLIYTEPTLKLITSLCNEYIVEFVTLNLKGLVIFQDFFSDIHYQTDKFNISINY